MATFFVGQRVRIVGVTLEHNRYLIGREERIVGLIPGLAILTLHPLKDGTRNIRLEHIEPILPDGHRACDRDFKRDLDRLLEREGVQA